MRRNAAPTTEDALKNAAAAVAGGAAGALAGGLMVRSGIAPTTAAIGLTAAGTAAAAATEGMTRLAAGGAAAAGAGQLALSWFATQTPPTVAALPAKGVTKRNASAADIEQAFLRAREQLAMEEEALAFSDDFDSEDRG